VDEAESLRKSAEKVEKNIVNIASKRVRVASEGRTGDDLILSVVKDTLELRGLGSLLDDGLDLVAEE
jgi:hypothetical protein